MESKINRIWEPLPKNKMGKKMFVEFGKPYKVRIKDNQFYVALCPFCNLLSLLFLATVFLFYTQTITYHFKMGGTSIRPRMMRFLVRKSNSGEIAWKKKYKIHTKA